MKFYNLDTEFTFGKHNGKNLDQVIITDSSYVNWCIIKLDHFFISEVEIENIKQKHPDFTISKFALEQLSNKEKEWYDSRDVEDYTYNSHQDYPSAYDSPYYNDDLDMDQQSPEFWDSL